MRKGCETSDKQFIHVGISGTLLPRRLIRNFISQGRSLWPIRQGFPRGSSNLGASAATSASPRGDPEDVGTAVTPLRCQVIATWTAVSLKASLPPIRCVVNTVKTLSTRLIKRGDTNTARWKVARLRKLSDAAPLPAWSLLRRRLVGQDSGGTQWLLTKQRPFWQDATQYSAKMTIHD